MKKVLFLAIFISIGICVATSVFWPMPFPIWQRQVKREINPINYLINAAEKPIEGVIVSPQTTAELKTWFQGSDENHVPRVFVEKLPSDFEREGNKQLFARVISALILRENEKIIKERAVLSLLAAKNRSGQAWTPRETDYFNQLVQKYDSQTKKEISAEIVDLSIKVYPIPPLMGVIQAAEATDWGKEYMESPFEQTGWLDRKTYARIPFQSLIRATESYVTEMNGLPTLSSWRFIRSQALVSGSDDIGYQALVALDAYKPDDSEYVERLIDLTDELEFEIPDNLSFIKPVKMKTIPLKVRRHTFQVELAETKEEKQRGLMFRPVVPDSTGMIFINEKARPMGIWMKNTFVPLDVLFFDENKKVTEILENLKPLDETPHRSAVPALGMVEFPAGTIQKYKIKVGDRLFF